MGARGGGPRTGLRVPAGRTRGVCAPDPPAPGWRLPPVLVAWPSAWAGGGQRACGRFWRGDRVGCGAHTWPGRGAAGVCSPGRPEEVGPRPRHLRRCSHRPRQAVGRPGLGWAGLGVSQILQEPSEVASCSCSLGSNFLSETGSKINPPKPPNL